MNTTLFGEKILTEDIQPYEAYKFFFEIYIYDNEFFFVLIPENVVTMQQSSHLIFMLGASPFILKIERFIAEIYLTSI
jgi:hypothetical protein